MLVTVLRWAAHTQHHADPVQLVLKLIISYWPTTWAVQCSRPPGESRRYRTCEGSFVSFLQPEITSHIGFPLGQPLSFHLKELYGAQKKSENLSFFCKTPRCPSHHPIHLHGEHGSTLGLGELLLPWTESLLSVSLGGRGKDGRWKASENWNQLWNFQRMRRRNLETTDRAAVSQFWLNYGME